MPLSGINRDGDPVKEYEMTTLISAREIQNMAREGKTCLELTPGMVVTPLARDAAQRAGIQIVPFSKGEALGAGKADALGTKDTPCREDAPSQGQGGPGEDELAGLEMVAGFTTLLQGLHERGILIRTGEKDPKAGERTPFHLVLDDGGPGTIEAGIDLVQPGRGMAWRKLEKDALVYLLEGGMGGEITGSPLDFRRGKLEFLPAGKAGPGAVKGRGRYFYFQYPV